MDSSVFFVWEFKENNGRNRRAAWHREFPHFSSLEDAYTKYQDVVDNCSNCKGHRLIRVESIGSKTLNTRVFFTLNSRPQEYKNANS